MRWLLVGCCLAGLVACTDAKPAAVATATATVEAVRRAEQQENDCKRLLAAYQKREPAGVLAEIAPFSGRDGDTFTIAHTGAAPGSYELRTGFPGTDSTILVGTAQVGPDGILRATFAPSPYRGCLAVVARQTDGRAVYLGLLSVAD